MEGGAGMNGKRQSKQPGERRQEGKQGTSSMCDKSVTANREEATLSSNPENENRETN